MLDCTIATEINNKEFDVEWSTDAISFTTIGVVLSKENSSSTVGYNYVHTHRVDGINFYR